MQTATPAHPTGPSGASPNVLQLRTNDGLTVAVPAMLSTITTYVLLEQEAWFETEIDFLRSYVEPGMTVIDIGANHGAYSLPLARLAGPQGQVFAYEPGGETRALFEQSRALNGLDNLKILPAALSDGAREGTLGFASSSELRALTPAGAGERIQITSLDLETLAQGWRAPDFIKIDAEGEEQKIIAGGKAFFSSYSPLIMFETKASETPDQNLRKLFPAIGYRLYRQLGSTPVLIPDSENRPVGEYELNLFAAKPDRAHALAQRGLLIETMAEWTPTDAARRDVLTSWRRQSFAASLDHVTAPADTDYLDCLAAYAAWRSADQPLAMRCAALAFAFTNLKRVCVRAANAERLSTLARVAADWGARGDSVATLDNLIRFLGRTPAQLSEPFWPASSRFESVPPGKQVLEWFVGATAEQLVRTGAFSSYYSGTTPILNWLAEQPFALPEMERRRVLIAARAGQNPRVPDKLRVDAPGHLNAEVWRSGRVPGTVL